MTERNIFLIIINLGLHLGSPIGGPHSKGSDYKGGETGGTRLLLGIIDPSERTTCTPLASIEVPGLSYEVIINQNKQLSGMFYGGNGYISNPHVFNEDEKTSVFDKITEIGCRIRELFTYSGRNPISDWLMEIFRPPQVKGGKSPNIHKNVTIITNDFRIPWYWLKNGHYGRFLCEVCSLGELQLFNPQELGQRRQLTPAQDRNLETFRALLINGSPELRFAGEELKFIEDVLSGVHAKRKRRLDLPVLVESVASKGELDTLDSKYDEYQLAGQFRIVHYSGHYSKKCLFVGNRPLGIWHLQPFIQDALLILDGCSSSQDLKAWADLEGLTSRLINEGGAAGCIVTALPVKHDPVAAEVFWETFYNAIRSKLMTVGQALVNARVVLKEHFASYGSGNPLWVSYQLIGSPAVRLLEDEGLIRNE